MLSDPAAAIVGALGTIRYCGSGGSGGYVPPAYYTAEDLRSALRNEYFYFQNDSKPTNAKVALGTSFVYPAGTTKANQMTTLVSSNKTLYKVSTAGTDPWNDSVLMRFDWTGFRSYPGRVGDLIFTRANFPGADIVKFFSGWTHVAMAYDIPNGKVFDSMLFGGVKVRNTSTEWGSSISYYTCKRITPLNPAVAEQCVKNAVGYWMNKPYIPSVLTSATPGQFMLKWSDKNDMSSMYCSKLVYHTFKDFVDLDSGRTAAPKNTAIQRTASGSRPFAWIGVSPDNLYYSAAMGPDFGFSSNIVYL